MKRILAAALCFALCLCTGCGKEDTAIGVIGGADGPTTVIVAGESFDQWEYDAYADELVYNFEQYNSACGEFNTAYNDGYADGCIAACESCIAALDGLIEAVPPASLSQYHEDVISGAEYEKEYYSGMKTLMELEGHADSLTAEEKAEADRINAFLDEYYEQTENPLINAWSAALDAAMMNY